MEPIGKLINTQNQRALFRKEGKSKNKDFKRATTTITPSILFNSFLQVFKEMSGRNFVENGNNLEVVKALCQYFARDPKFLENPILPKVEIVPSLDRGIALFGNNGTGKTIIMKCFSNILHRFQNQKFNVKTTRSITNELSPFCTPGYLISKYSDHKRCFDDLTYEKNIKNYGNEINILEDALFNRYANKVLTHITLNTPDNYSGSFEEVVDQIYDRYGKRVFDRVFEMCNFIELTGKSLRGL